MPEEQLELIPRDPKDPPPKRKFAGNALFLTRTGSSRKYTPKLIADAIIMSAGCLSEAARRIGCHRETVVRAVRDFEYCQRALEHANLTDLDFSVSHLKAARDAGEPWAILAHLKSAKAIKYGYAPSPAARVEVSGPGGGPVKFQALSYDDGCLG